MISHDGAMDGHYTQVSLMPDMDIGIYSTMNYRDVRGERQWLHAYVMDVLMGEDAWFNATDVCPGLPIPNNDVTGDVPSFRTAGNRRLLREESAQRPLGNYVGVYGNFAYGNISIYQEDEDEVLHMQYGNNGYYDLVPTESEDVFGTVGNRSPADYLDIGQVFFDSSDEGGGGDIVDLLTIPSFSLLDPQVFIRDLQFADAPPPSLEGCQP